MTQQRRSLPEATQEKDAQLSTDAGRHMSAGAPLVSQLRHNMLAATLGCVLLLVVAGLPMAAAQLPPGITELLPSPSPNNINYTALVTQYQYQSLDVCDNPNTPPFLRHPANNVQYFQNASSWDTQRWVDWVSQDLKDKWIPSAVFVGIAAASLIILLVWRLVTSCLVCCGRFHRKDKQFMTSNGGADPYHAAPDGHGCGAWCRAHNSSRTMMWLKPFVLLSSLVAIAFIAYGLATASHGLADQAWETVNAVSNQVSIITYQVQYTLNNASTANAALNSLEQAAAGLPAPVQPSVQAVLQPVNTVVDQMNAVIATYSDKAAAVRADVTGKIQSAQDDHYDTTQSVDKAQYIITIVLFSLGLLFIVLLLLAMALNIPGLFTFSNICQHILLLLYFMLALIAAWALSGGVDVCPAAETIVKEFVPNNRAILLNYYMFGVGGTVQDVLRASGIIDIPNIDALASTALSALQAANTSLQQLPSAVTSDPSVQQLQQALNQAQSTVVNTQAAEQLLIQVSSYQAVNPLYVAAKAYACCDVRNDILHLWIALTGAAWAMLVMAWLANGLIGEYDKAPGAHQGACRGCCGCSRLGPFNQQPLGQTRSEAGHQNLVPPADMEYGKAGGYNNHGGYVPYNGNGAAGQSYGHTIYKAGPSAPPVQMAGRSR